MTAEFKWDEQKLNAARLLAVGEQTQADIAKAIGIAERTIRNWLQHEVFRDEVARQEASYVGVAEEIRKRCERAQQHTITRQQIVGRLVEIANASLGDFVDCHGELDMVKARNSKKDHLLKKIRVIKRTSRDGSSRITKEFEIESPLAALDLLAEITGIKKERQKNPIDSAREVFRIMRQKEQYKDMSNRDLAAYPAQNFNVSVDEILQGVEP